MSASFSTSPSPCDLSSIDQTTTTSSSSSSSTTTISSSSSSPSSSSSSSTSQPRNNLSFSVKGDVIQAGDLVIVMAGAGRTEQLLVERGTTHRSSKWGRILLDDLVGRHYGEKIALPTLKGCGKGKNRRGGYIYVLKPRPELLAEGAMVLQTAIVDPVDSAHIVWSLALRPGSVVAEAGTGSGSLTRCFSRAVAPRGWVLTFEYHQGRAAKARAALLREGFSRTAQEEGEEERADKPLIPMHILEREVIVTHRDVVKEGFGPRVPDASVHAVMLDLPSPWDVVKEAKRVLRPQGRICCYSPCIEQVQKNCKQLRRHGFVDVVTEEVIQRPYHLYDPPQVYDPVDFQLFRPSSSAKRPSPQSDVAARWWYNPSTPDAPQYAVPSSSIRGHTAFLTFATLPPSSSSSAFTSTITSSSSSSSTTSTTTSTSSSSSDATMNSSSGSSSF